MQDFEFGPDRLPDPAALARVFEESGVVILRGYLAESPAYRAYLAELRQLFAVLARRLGVPAEEPGLGRQIATVFAADNYYPRYVHDLGTHPMKLVSGNLLKFSDAILAPVRAIFGDDAILASPTGSDNLLFFFPGDKFKKYSLPLHQDFPYIMQSARQLTVWIPLTEPAPGVGGFVAWPGSHQAGVRPQKPGPTGLEVQVSPAELASIEPVIIEGRPGDVVISHSLLVHKSAPNTSVDELRAVQLFRFSDLRTAEAERYFWQSTSYSGGKGSISFAEAYPELVAVE
jgi:1-deoxypentalenic acid 11beta-hydroxylase